MSEKQSEDSKKVTEELLAAGHEVSSVWDYINGVKLPAGAVGPLLDVLPKVKDNRTKEGIVRALADKVAKNTKAFDVLAAMYIETDDHLLKWAIGNTLNTIATPANLDRLLELAADAKQGEARQMLLSALGRFPDSRCEDVLISAATDKRVAGHALGALGKLQVARALPVVEKYLKDPNPFFRKAATTAVRRIRGD